MTDTVKIKGTLVEGYRVASGLSKISPYPKGTIEMQRNFFIDNLDLSNIYSGTLNINIAPKQWKLVNPYKTFKNVKWSNKHDSEDFHFMHCNVYHLNDCYRGYVYFPSPETKKVHFQNTSTLEVLAPYIDGIKYNDMVILEIKPDEISVY
jgi:hypothetical protein